MTVVYWAGAGFLVTCVLFFLAAMTWLAYEYVKMKIDESPGQIKKVKRETRRALLIRLSDDLHECEATSDLLTRLSHYNGISHSEMQKLISDWRRERTDLREAKDLTQ